MIIGKYIYSDGGRRKSGRHGRAGDCVCRAIAIITNEGYEDIYNELAWRNEAFGDGIRSARDGISDRVMHGLLKAKGFKYVRIKQKQIYAVDLPKGRIVALVERHAMAVVNNVVIDSWDSRKKNIRGYFIKPEEVWNLYKDNEFEMPKMERWKIF